MTLSNILHNFQASGLNSHFIYKNLSFKAYCQAVRAMLRKAREDVRLPINEEHIELNSPFELAPEKPNHKGALLIHGLFDSPFIMRDIGNHLVKQGYLVRAILLPGHATIPADLLTTSYREWLKATEYGVKSFANQVDELYLVGFSTGAALALHEVLYHTKSTPPIAGLVLLSPAIAINTITSIYVRLLRTFRWLFKDQKWILRNECPDYTKYTSFPVNSAYHLKRIISENNRALAKRTLSIPVFMAMSEDDETVRCDAAIKFFERCVNPDNMFMLYGNSGYNYKNPQINLVPSKKLSQKILDMSHVAIPVAPTNLHYGKKGDHQEPIQESKNEIQDTSVFLGALSTENEKFHRLRRLTFNPFFSKLMDQLDYFLNYGQ
ncbi:MAG: alpha/beta fold hydrolase [Gammaproteobacteria bacterium]|nr:alpha/beta fold hydrolase [Gammaproteobacteria bacterium]